MSGRIFVFIFCFIVSSFSYSQDGSVRLRVFTGSNIDFIFNSISDYKNGITYLNNTVIGIEATDPNGGTNRTAWRVEVSADDADADGFLTGTDITNQIPFSSIQVQATSISTCPAPCPINLFGSPWRNLSTVPVILIDGNAFGGADDIVATPVAANTELGFNTDQVNISFRAGVVTSLLGSSPDYYSDDIFFDIYLTPPF